MSRYVLQVNEECSTLRLSLSEAQHECEVAKGEVATLQLKVTNLETLVQVRHTKHLSRALPRLCMCM